MKMPVIQRKLPRWNVTAFGIIVFHTSRLVVIERDEQIAARFFAGTGTERAKVFGCSILTRSKALVEYERAPIHLRRN
jgi:hypothetical protein